MKHGLLSVRLFIFMSSLLLPVTSVSGFAQEQQVAQSMESWGKMGGAGGFLPLWFRPSVKDVNSDLASFGMPDFGSRGIFLYGGGGYVYINIIKNMRIGGMGAGGSLQMVSTANGVRREAMLSTGFGGATVEIAFPIQRKVDVALGVILGGGGLGLRLSRQIDETKDWTKALSELRDGTSADVVKEFNAGFFTLQPTAYVEIHLANWLGLRLGGGYNVSFMGSWSSNEFDATGVPPSFKATGLSLQGGLFVGSFFDNF